MTIPFNEEFSLQNAVFFGFIPLDVRIVGFHVVQKDEFVARLQDAPAFPEHPGFQRGWYVFLR